MIINVLRNITYKGFQDLPSNERLHTPVYISEIVQLLAKSKVDFLPKLTPQTTANQVTNNNNNGVGTVCSTVESINIQGLCAPHNQYITENRICIINFCVWMSTLCLRWR